MGRACAFQEFEVQVIQDAADELALGRGDGEPEAGGAFDYAEPF